MASNLMDAWAKSVNAKLAQANLLWQTAAPCTLDGKLRMPGRGSNFMSVALNGGVALRASSIYWAETNKVAKLILTPLPPIPPSLSHIRHFELDERDVMKAFGLEARQQFDTLLLSDDLVAMTNAAEKEQEAERRKVEGARIGETAGFGDW